MKQKKTATQFSCIFIYTYLHSTSQYHQWHRLLKLTGHHNWWKQGEGELDGEPTIFCLGQKNQAAKKTSRYPSAKGSTPPWGQGLGEGCCQSPFCNLSQSFCLLGHLLREDDPSQVSGILCWLIKIQWDWAWLPQTVQHHTHLCSCCSQN